MFARRPTLVLLLVASGLSAFVSYGLLNWAPAYLMRVRHMPLVEVARWFGPVAGLCLGLGIWGGGVLVNRSSSGGAKAYGLVPGLAMLIAAPTLVAALMATTWQLSLALMTVPMICVTIYVAPALALVQNLTPVTARATATAILLLAFNIIGLGCGPLAIGWLSDTLAHDGVASSLRIALMGVAPLSLVAAGLYFALSRVAQRDSDAILEEARPCAT